MKKFKIFQKIEKAGILHTNYKSFLKFLLKMDNEKNSINVKRQKITRFIK